MTRSGGLPLEPVEPSGWARPRGYSNGMLAPAGGRILFVAGQIGWDETQRLVEGGFTDTSEYLAEIQRVGETYREVMGRHYPAMALLGVGALLEPKAKVEIEGMAVIPES